MLNTSAIEGEPIIPTHTAVSLPYKTQRNRNTGTNWHTACVGRESRYCCCGDTPFLTLFFSLQMDTISLVADSVLPAKFRQRIDVSRLFLVAVEGLLRS